MCGLGIGVPANILEGVLMGFRSTAHLLRVTTIAAAVLVLGATGAAAQPRANSGAPQTNANGLKKSKAIRNVELRWNFDADPGRQFEVWIDCQRGDSDSYSTCPSGQPYRGMEARAFELLKTDRVFSYASATRSRADYAIEIQNAVTGTNVDDKAREALSKLLIPQDIKKAQGASVKSLEELVEEVVFLNEKLLAGGKLTTTFVLKKKEADGKTSVEGQSPAIPLGVRSEAPWFSMSYGIGLSTTRNSDVTVIKTNTLVTFEKDGKTQQAYQQQVHVTDATAKLRPIEAATVFVGFRLAGPTYALAGFSTTSSIFKEPMLGIGCRIPMGNMALMVGGGAHFTNEKTIVDGTNFSDGTKLDPALSLTSGDIPTEEKRRTRLFLGFGVEF